MNQSGIYAIEHLASGKAYVGSAVRLTKRWRLHKLHLGRGTHHSVKLQNAWNKYGAEAFRFVVLEAVDREPAADFKARLLATEQGWIDGFGIEGYNILARAGNCMGNTWNVGRKASEATKAKKRAIMVGNGYSRGVRHTDATRAKVSASLAGNSYRKGIPNSPETRARMSAAGKGRKQSPEHIAKRIASRLATVARKHAMAEG